MVNDKGTNAPKGLLKKVDHITWGLLVAVGAFLWMALQGHMSSNSLPAEKPASQTTLATPFKSLVTARQETNDTESRARDFLNCLSSQEELMTMPVDWPGFHALCIETINENSVTVHECYILHNCILPSFDNPLPLRTDPAAQSVR